MSHLIIVGGSTGIGRDIVPYLICGDARLTVTHVRRDQAPSDVADIHRSEPITSLLFCQRYRPDDGPHMLGKDWHEEFRVSLTRSKEMFDWAGASSCVASVIVMASVAAVSVEEEQPVSYHACKAALVEMVKYYAVTLGPKQIRVNAIIPGLTIKPEARAFYGSHAELEILYKDITPLGRMGTVEDIANLVDFLISERSSYLTGQTITLDGGIGLRSHWALARKVTPALKDVQVTQQKVTA